jgi:hypothetical protein
MQKTALVSPCGKCAAYVALTAVLATTIPQAAAENADPEVKILVFGGDGKTSGIDLEGAVLRSDDSANNALYGECKNAEIAVGGMAAAERAPPLVSRLSALFRRLSVSFYAARARCWGFMRLLSNELAGQGGWDLHAHRAIHEELPLVAHRLKQSGIGATGANGVEHLAGSGKGHGIASRQVRGEDAQRDAHFLKPVGFQEPLQEPVHPLATDQPETAEAPAPDIAEAHRTTGARDLFGRGATGVRGGDNGSGAYAGNAVDGDAVLLNKLKDAGMSDASGETAAQSQADPNQGRLPQSVQMTADLTSPVQHPALVHAVPLEVLSLISRHLSGVLRDIFVGLGGANCACLERRHRTSK